MIVLSTTPHGDDDDCSITTPHGDDDDVLSTTLHGDDDDCSIDYTAWRRR
uniref:Uncharacterized protein n=1 Tax=Cucumis melo TaxID=3656 RepID=A0A9I9E306_CUCME